MGTLMGFVFGYIAGVKSGPEGLDQLLRAWQDISKSDEFKALLASGAGVLQNALAQGGGAFAEQLKSLMQGNGDMQKGWDVLAQSTELQGAWQTISQSPQFQGLVASGVSLIGGALEQGKSVLSERLH